MEYYGLQVRLAFDLSPMGLRGSASRCQYCAIILAAMQQFHGEIGNIETDVRRIYVQRPEGLQHMTLTPEIYFNDSRPTLELEIYAEKPVGKFV
jgi:hypothetical protein